MSFQLLKYVAAGGGVLSIGGACFFFYKIQDNLRAGTYFSKSIEILKNHPVTEDKLGLPVRTKFLDLSDKFNFVQGTRAEIAIPVRGSKGRGTVFTWSTRADPYDEEWVVQKMQLKMKGTSNLIDLYEAPPQKDTEQGNESSDKSDDFRGQWDL